MPPKHKATAQDKGKGHVSGSSTRTRLVAEPPDDGDIPRFHTNEIKVCYTTTWASKVCHKERQVTWDDFFHHLLERVIQHCGWYKVADAPQVAYPTLVREFFANFNLDIDVPESSHRYKTGVRGQWIRFSPTMIDSSNINPTRQRTRFTEHRAILLHHLARLRHLTFPTEEVDTPALLLNARSVENSETKIVARGGRVHAASAMNAGEDYPDDADPAPPPAPATGSDLSIQIAQLMAAQTEMGRAIGTIQGAILHIQQTNDVVLGNLMVVTGQVGDL
ncbi:hypothetical protein Adt_27721 [Abeliophyllum distichum]|uniref:Uncharacterized protein n=1 Tax=Abeliophyllum distichum TaxID=126358 RepID=A0ABD1RUI8_9LAMI